MFCDWDSLDDREIMAIISSFWTKAIFYSDEADDERQLEDCSMERRTRCEGGSHTASTRKPIILLLWMGSNWIFLKQQAPVLSKNGRNLGGTAKVPACLQKLQNTELQEKCQIDISEPKRKKPFWGCL